ncbi:MAG: hypothetical protein NTW87_35350, partial [Planctomycetota bacterium]|nr:hypothetical protein [Planctomycetota bacterium]
GLTVVLGLGHKLRMDIVSARGNPELRTPNSEPRQPEGYDVLLTSGGGADWETTLEEALLSLYHATPPAAAPGDPGPTAVLAFSGEAGLGSAHFTLDLWSLLQQAEEVLASGRALADLAPRPAAFDPAATVAFALSGWRQVALLSPGLAEHEEGEELGERLKALPGLASRIRLCAGERELWELLAQWHGPQYRLRVHALGWRALCGT